MSILTNLIKKTKIHGSLASVDFGGKNISNKKPAKYIAGFLFSIT
jgi:hypothetical protein